MKLAFCGAGLMGSAMIRRLLAAGAEVSVWNRTAAKAELLRVEGAQVCQTPAAAARDADAALLCLTDEAAVEEVVFGPGGLAQSPPPYIVDHSSIGPEATRDLARRADWAAWIDAPVSGGVAGAAAGRLAVMAGGTPMAIAAVTPMIAPYTGNLTHMGPVGSGQATKLCNQTIVAATIVALAEAVALAAATGVEIDRLSGALAGGWADSVLLRTFVPPTPPETRAVGPISLMLKDVDNIAAAAQAMGVAMPVTAAVQETLQALAACEPGYDIGKIVDRLRLRPTPSPSAQDAP